MEPYKAACLGVYLHGLAGDYAAAKKGTYSMIAGDILESIEQVLLA
jgi:NAD(P)H-hydrate epimerase